MKNFFLLLGLLLMQSLIFAERYQQAKIILQNGTELEGMATFPSNPVCIPILFKENNKAKPQSINCDDIKTIVYLLNNDKTIEYDRMNAYLGGLNKKVQKVWLEVSKRGTATLYTYVALDAYGGTNPTTYSTRNAMEKYWLCYRSGEDAATIIASTAMKNKNDDFVKKVLEYFKDDPDLTGKIKTNEYKWSDMDKIIDEYNERKKNKT